MSKYFTYMALAVLLFTGCSKYGYVSLNYPLPPQAMLPEHIQTIALVNRSLTRDKDRKTKILESIAKGELAGSDKIASDECLKGAFDRINGLRGISIVFPQRTRLYGTGTRETPEILDWKVVKGICDSSHADALLALETFDSNTNLLTQAVTNQVVNVLNGQAPRLTIPNQVRMNVYCYWRLYDPSTEKIVDQYQSTSYQTFNAVGQDYLLTPPEALPRTAYAAGQLYMERFLPGYYTVRRDMYKRGKGKDKQAFKAAFRSAEVANWQNAIDGWTQILQNSGRKTSGRACLDIAVAYEVLGNTDKALEWCKRSYEQYRDRLGRDYTNILLRRKNLEY